MLGARHRSLRHATLPAKPTDYRLGLSQKKRRIFAAEMYLDEDMLGKRFFTFPVTL